MKNKISAIFKMLGLLSVSLVIIPLQSIVLALSKGRISYFLPQLWHRLFSCIFGLKVSITGRPVSKKQVFFVGNHLSHFDIFILGSVVRASFVAKDDLSRSPALAFLCRLQQTAFISRSSGQAAKVQNDINAMIKEGKSIILFPEGTSTRGETVLDFKSSLFSLPLQYADRGLAIQPFTIKLLTVDGKPADTKALRDIYAWDRDNPIELGPHIWNFMHTSGASLQLVFHDPIAVEPGEDRKSLAKKIRQIVAGPLEQPNAA